MMDVRPLHTESDYNWALAEIARYFETQPAPRSAEGNRFEVLSVLIKEYEDRHFRIPRHSDPVDVLHFAIDSMGKSQAELAALIGRNRASEILNRERRLTLDMIRTISVAWHLPIETLTGAYEIKRESA
jgi:HTH-type transcriptional regulator/antitoxin HigA